MTLNRNVISKSMLNNISDSEMVNQGVAWSFRQTQAWQENFTIDGSFYFLFVDFCKDFKK